MKIKIHVIEHVQVQELVSTKEESKKVTKLDQEYKTKVHSLEKEIRTLKEENYKLFTPKGTSLLQSTLEKPTNQLSRVMVV